MLCYIYFSPYLEELELDILHITKINFNINKLYCDMNKIKREKAKMVYFHELQKKRG